MAGRVDVVVNDLLNQKILSQEYEGAKIVCDPFTHAENAIAVQKEKMICLHLSMNVLTSIMQTALMIHSGQNGSMLPAREKKQLQQKMRKPLNKA